MNMSLGSIIWNYPILAMLSGKCWWKPVLLGKFRYEPWK